MSDEARHEQMTETRSWSEYDDDGNVTADHTTSRAICGTCYREQFGRRGHLEYVSADYPCEVTRLRERVASLEAAGRGLRDAAVFASNQFDAIGNWADERLSRGERRELMGLMAKWAAHEDAVISRWNAALAGQEPANWGPAVMEHRIARTVLENMAGQEQAP